jgi:transcriptional regulator with XRE-family HTH domain
MVKRKAPLSKALTELRTRLDESQASLAQRLSVSTQTINLWETRRAPGGHALLGLARLAEDEKQHDLARVFAAAVKKESPRMRRDIETMQQYWAAINVCLADIQTEAEKLKASGNPSGKAISDKCNDMWEHISTIESSFWRNQR